MDCDSKVCALDIRFRSKSGLISKSDKTWSSIVRCCAVTQTNVLKEGLFLKALTTEAILIASGLVPKMISIFFKMDTKPKRVFGF